MRSVALAPAPPQSSQALRYPGGRGGAPLPSAAEVANCGALPFRKDASSNELLTPSSTQKRKAARNPMVLRKSASDLLCYDV